MQKFRIRNLQILVATDVAARGLDVNDLTHIINYGLPEDSDIYNHRSGRTGRAGKTGISIAIIHSKERNRLRDIERRIGKQFEVGTVPTGKSICEKQIINLADKLEKVKVNEEEIGELLPSVFRKLDWLTKEDLIKRLVSLEFNRMAVAIYLAEIANSRIRKILKPLIELLAGIPSVVYGFFGLIVIVPLIRSIFHLPVGETALAGALVLAIMALPTIITVAEDAMRTTPLAMD